VEPTTKMMKYIALVLVALFAMSQGATLSTTSMVNASALVGGSTTFICTVDGSLGLGETLNIYKIFGNNENFLISQGAVVANSTKHSVTGTYTLNINTVTFSDEGMYTCSLGVASTSAYLYAGVAPSNAWLYFKGNVSTAVEGVKTNLTCEADSSYPPATMRWFKGATEVTTTAKVDTVTVDANGYGASMSHLELTPTAADAGVVYTCHVDVPGGTSFFTKTLTVAMSGSSTIVASFGLLLAALIASKF
jgi:hypothetical protein